MTKVLKFFKDNTLAIFAITCFVVCVLINKNFYMYFSDELHAFVLAKLFNPIEIIKLMRAEGHTVLWYLLIKPIPNIYGQPPYLLKVLSFLFSFVSICILWFKSPFSKFLKFLITFSYPMLAVYPILARPYSLGVMCIFILAAFYPKRLQYPILYSILIFITANTCLMAAIGASAFGLILILDLLKTKNKNLVPVFIIAIICIASLFIQWHNPIMPCYQMGRNLKNFLFNWYNLKILKTLSLFVIPFCTLSAIYYFFKDKRALFFFLYNNILLLIIFVTLYHGNEYHFYFLYIYFIVSYWISSKNITSETIKKIFYTFFIILNIMMSMVFRYKQLNRSWYINYDSYLKTLANIEATVPTGSTIYTNIFWHDILALFKNKMNVHFVDSSGNELYSFNNYLHIYDRTSFSLENALENAEKAEKDSYILLRLRNYYHQSEYLREYSKNITVIKTYNGLNLLYKIK